VTDFAPGDRVVGMIPFARIGGRVGAYAEAAAVDPDWLAPIDPGVSWDEAATLPLNALTAREGLDLLSLPRGARLLITGASGAVGGFATQLAAEAGLNVLGVAGRDDEDWLAGLGAAEVLPRDADLNAIDPVDGVFDAVPLGPAATTGALRDGGTAVFTRPPDPPESDRVRLEVFLVSPNAAALRELAAQLGAGRLKTRVARVLPLDEVAEGHRLAEAGGTRGKIVLRMG
jgi:NADPH:quinone reductase